MEINPILMGWVISVVMGFFVNYLVLDVWLWPRQRRYSKMATPDIQDGPPNDRIIVAVLGVCDRITFTLSIIMGRPEWIAFWLTLKTAVKMPSWMEDKFRDFNVFLIGNAISIIFAVAGAKLITEQYVNSLTVYFSFLFSLGVVLNYLMVFLLIKKENLFFRFRKILKSPIPTEEVFISMSILFAILILVIIYM